MSSERDSPKYLQTQTPLYQPIEVQMLRERESGRFPQTIPSFFPANRDPEFVAFFYDIL